MTSGTMMVNMVSGFPPPSPSDDKIIKKKEKARQSLEAKVHKRIASLTEPEAFFLKALLIDDDKSSDNAENPEKAQEETEKLLNASQKLNDEMLFSVPKEIPDHFKKVRKPPRRPSTKGLWHAHEDGVHPRMLTRRSSRGSSHRIRTSSIDDSISSGLDHSFPRPPRPPTSSIRHLKPGHRRTVSNQSASSYGSHGSSFGFYDEEIYPSDEEVRPDEDKQGSVGESSWDSKEGANNLNFDAWEVLKDEYAADFGFDYTAPSGRLFDDDDLPNSFQILGTSADDESCQPHVMSPPMMDALMSFLPENLLGQNYWLRFSLARDGACLDTLKRYVRAAECTIIAIETPKGEVFGSFTSSAWRNQFGYYGHTPAFVWKMRHSRQTKCASLYDQAQLESEIDVFMASGYHERIQVCRHDAIAVGGDETLPNVEEYENIQEALAAASHHGFAFCLEDDLLRGTTSQCQTFHSPALCGNGNGSQVFEVAGLEVWSLTPQFDVKAAEKLEMTKFFVEESVRSMSTASSTTRSRGTSFSGSFDLMDQESFYRRVGHDPESEVRRDRWQYINTMSGVGSKQRGMGASPRFN